MTVEDANLAGRRVLVTGAGGFIGRRLVQALDEAGARVTIFRRAGRRTWPRDRTAIREIAGDLRNKREVAAALDGQEIVFHLAYDGRAPASDNLAGFESVLAGSVAAGVSRIVHTSSIVVYDAWPDGNIDESSSTSRPGASGYRQAKIEMERRLMVGPIPAAILQPTIVYGPGSAFWTEQFLEWLAVGNIVVPTPEGHCCGVYVDDVVQALIRAAKVPDLGHERFIVSGSEPFRWSQLFEGYAHILGRGYVRHKPAEELQLRLGSSQNDGHGDEEPSRGAFIHATGRRIFGRERFERMVRWTKRRLARNRSLYPDAHLLELFSATGRCNIRHAEQRLGFNPAFDLERGLAETAAGLRSGGRDKSS